MTLIRAKLSVFFLAYLFINPWFSDVHILC